MEAGEVIDDEKDDPGEEAGAPTESPESGAGAPEEEARAPEATSEPEATFETADAPQEEGEGTESSDDESGEGAKPKKSRSRKKKPEPTVDTTNMEWYVLKVQSNREESIRDAIYRRLKIEGLDQHVAEIVVPTERVIEMKEGKKRIVKKKFYPGYIILHMEMKDEVWFSIRDTPGVGHFVGAGPREKPLPMPMHEVEKMLGRIPAAGEEQPDKAPRPEVLFSKGERVTIKEGPFENFEGEVEDVNEDKGMVRVVIQIFNRPTPVDVEYWQLMKVRD